MQTIVVRAVVVAGCIGVLGLRAGAQAAPAPPPSDGAKIYAATCATCHQATGLGLAEKNYPPLAGSEWVTGSEERLVLIILHGLTGEIEVEGETYSGAMPTWGPAFKDPDLAAVASYVRRMWGNKAAPVAAETVTRLRLKHADRKTPWTVAELRRATAARN